MSGYAVAPLFLIRLAGVPFEPLVRLATRKSCSTARELIERPSARERAADDVRAFVQLVRDVEVWRPSAVREADLASTFVRAAKGWPRHVYIRPIEQALRRSGAEGRDKDTKPGFIDLESYLSLEIFQRWLVKAGELEITEMLPDAEHLCWQEEDGRRPFELRTLIGPRT
ncbi:MAG: hypothetical protein ACR2ID_08695 [Chthoniobacterales bacterium]